MRLKTIKNEIFRTTYYTKIKITTMNNDKKWYRLLHRLPVLARWKQGKVEIDNDNNQKMNKHYMCACVCVRTYIIIKNWL